MTLNVDLTENTAASTLNFGAPGQDGVVIGDGGGGDVATINVVAGTLRSANASFSNLLSAANSITVDAGATLETAGGLDLTDLLGGGQVVDNGAAGNFTLLQRANFSGSISGPFSLAFDSGSIAGMEATASSAATTPTLGPPRSIPGLSNSAMAARPVRSAGALSPSSPAVRSSSTATTP
jgi:hypothetical protein